MAHIRLTALESIRHNQVNGSLAPAKISEHFNEYVFDVLKMKQYLSREAYQEVVAAGRENLKLSGPTANVVASAMKSWAMDLGVTHFTHWFQPLTSLTGEKHDAFFKPSLDPETRGIEYLTGAELLQREPDASSFPNGGLRGTHEARGYTVWDPTSPAFIMESDYGRTLYIPSVFLSYTGEALDYKGPLLRSVDALNKAALAVLHRFFNHPAKYVTTTLGWEQEYFLVDAELLKARPDLLMAGRTLFGAPAAKGQEKADHYFGVIPERVLRFMHHFEREALKLGIPVLTRHNEVAPGQYELAPMFEEVNKAVDHNLLVMTVMRRIAQKHNLAVLFHEKPFAGVNGSGKHNNWSLMTDRGENLLDPGPTPGQNLQFLTFMVCVIRAIDQYEEVLRASIANSGNDHRLGANEAPPAIMSVFTGSFMKQVLDGFQEKGLDAPLLEAGTAMEVSVPKIPQPMLDNTDRNRTSPFPFTGNKFEFRAVGANDTCSFANTTLNTMMAATLNDLVARVDALTAQGKTDREALVAVLQHYLKDSDRIVFNGDGYAKAWEDEAVKRGIHNIRTSTEAFHHLIGPKAVQLFGEMGVLNRAELQARVNIAADNFAKDLETEAHLYEELLMTHIVPAAVKSLNDLLANQRGLAELGLNDVAEDSRQHIDAIAQRVTRLRNLAKRIAHGKHEAWRGKDGLDVAERFQALRSLFAEARAAADELELLVDDQYWTLPKYRELLYVR